MKLTADGIALVKARESCRLKAYRCPAGIWSIAYGHTGEEVHEDMEVTQDEADALLQADLVKFDAYVARKCPESDPLQHDAMCDLAYNIGCGAFSTSSVARLHNAKRYPEAAQAFLLFNKAGGKVLPGLVSRRAAEMSMYLRGVPDDQFSTESMTPASTAEGEKPMSQSRTINGGAAAGIGTVATAGLSSLNGHQDVMTQITDALGGVAPYLPTIGYVIAGVTCAGLIYSMYARWHDRQEGRS